MTQRLSGVTMVVGDYDEAIAFYTEKLDFEVAEDTPLGDGKRWVTISLPGATETRLLLAQADGARQEARIGHQTGGRVFLFLTTDDFRRDHERMLARGVRFLEEPRREPYGTVAVFVDLYGNKWDLIEPEGSASPWAMARPDPAQTSPTRRDSRSSPPGAPRGSPGR